MTTPMTIEYLLLRIRTFYPIVDEENKKNLMQLVDWMERNAYVNCPEAVIKYLAALQNQFEIEPPF